MVMTCQTCHGTGHWYTGKGQEACPTCNVPSPGKGFADQVWGLSLLAQAELENGDVEGVQKTLVRITEVAAAMSGNQ